MILNELGERGINNVLQNRLNMVGDAPAPSLVPEVTSSLVIESDRPEWAYYKGETPFSVYVREVGGVGVWTSLQIQAPSRILMVITEIESVLTATALELGWGAGPAFGVTAVSGIVPTDNRYAILTGLNVLAGTTIAQPPFSHSSPIARTTDAPQPIFKGPYILANLRRSLIVRATQVNQTVEVNIRGYTRPLLPNELV